MKPGLLQIAAVTIASSLFLPALGRAQSLGPVLLGFVRTPSLTRAILLDEGAEGRRNGPYTLAESERRGSIELLSVDVDRGVARIKSKDTETELQFAGPGELKSDRPATEATWCVRLNRFPARRILMFYALAGEVALAHANLEEGPISLSAGGRQKEQFLNDLDGALARHGIRVQHVEQKFALLSALKEPAPQMHTWAIPPAKPGDEALSSGTLQLTRMELAQAFEIYAQVSGYEIDRASLIRPGTTGQQHAAQRSAYATLLAGTDVTTGEARHALETVLDWGGLGAQLTPDGKLRALWHDSTVDPGTRE